MGSGASGIVSQSSGALVATTTTNKSSGYNTLPIIRLTGGGNPGVVTGYTTLVAGADYTSYSQRFSAKAAERYC
jgi:hypothetical protein